MNYLFFSLVFVNIGIIEYLALEKFNVPEWNNESYIKTAVTKKLLGTELRNDKKIRKRQVLIQRINKTSLPGATNLKYNIFDKMLSEEMLSIKQHFYEKDSSYSPSVHITVNGNVATPTLEMNQKWPIKNMLFKSFSKNNNDSRPLQENDEQIKAKNNSNNGTLNKSLNENNSCERICNDQIKNKILGLRSLTDSHISEKKMCSCMKTNPRPTCSQRCTGNHGAIEKGICSHTPNDENPHHQCTRTTTPKPISYSVIYVTYPYFWQISTYSIKPYHHPNPFNENKMSKTKKRPKNKKPVIYDENELDQAVQEHHEIYQERKDNYWNFVDDYYYDDDFNKLSKHEKQGTPHDNIQEIEYEENNSRKLHVVDTELFVDNVVNDLKRDYSDVVIKDCYCSSLSSSVLHNILSKYVLWAYLSVLLLY